LYMQPCTVVQRAYTQRPVCIHTHTQIHTHISKRCTINSSKTHCTS